MPRIIPPTYTDAQAVSAVSTDDAYLKNDGDTGTGVYDFGSADSLEIPNSATPTVNVAGEIAIDTTITDHTALIRYYGAEELIVPAVPTDKFTTVDGHVIVYNATNNEFEMAAPAGGGDVTGDSASADKELVRFNGTGGKTIESPVTDLATTTATLSDNADLTLYDNVNNGNPVFSYGSSATERLKITPSYASGGVALEFVEFDTPTASATTDRGEYRFKVDETLVATIDDGGLEIKASGSLSFGAVDILTDSTGTTTLNNIDVLDATTEGTIEAAIDTLANLTSIQGLAVTLADAGADAIFGWDDGASAYENLTQAEVLGVIGSSSTTAQGVVELATGDETNTGTDATRAVTPDGLDDWTGSAQITTLGTLAALTVDDVGINGKVITITGSASDLITFTGGTNGTLVIQTVDDAGAAANLTLTIDGTIDIDSAGVLTLDSGAAINLEPAVGSAVLIDGTVSIDGGAVTGVATLDASGDITAANFQPDGATSSGDSAAVGYTSTDGLILTGQGSSNDVTIKNDADADVITIPTGTTNVTFAGVADMGGGWESTAQPAFAVTKNDAQVLTKSVFTKVQYDDEEFDNGSDYDAATEHEFVAPTDGVYYFHATVSITALTDGKFGIISLFKNDAEVRRGNRISASETSTLGINVSALLSLSANDVIDVQAFHNNATDENVTAAAEVNHFQGWKVM